MSQTNILLRQSGGIECIILSRALSPVRPRRSRDAPVAPPRLELRQLAEAPWVPSCPPERSSESAIYGVGSRPSDY